MQVETPFDASYRPFSWRFAVNVAVFMITTWVAVNLINGDGALSHPVSLGILLLFSLVAIVAAWKAWGGAIALTSSGIRYDAGWSRRRYPWKDIETVRVSRISEMGAYTRFSARVFGMDLTRPLVVVQTKKWLRQNSPRGLSTRGYLPIPFLNRQYLYADDPESFVAAVKPFLSTASSNH